MIKSLKAKVITLLAVMSLAAGISCGGGSGGSDNGGYVSPALTLEMLSTDYYCDDMRYIGQFRVPEVFRDAEIIVEYQRRGSTETTELRFTPDSQGYIDVNLNLPEPGNYTFNIEARTPSCEREGNCPSLDDFVAADYCPPTTIPTTTIETTTTTSVRPTTTTTSRPTTTTTSYGSTTTTTIQPPTSTVPSTVPSTTTSTGPSIIVVDG